MISFIYFDVGGVVIKDFSKSNKWDEMKRGMGVTKEKDADFEKFWDKYADRYDLDQDIDDLIPLLRSQLKLPLPKDYSWLDDFVDRFEPNYSLWNVIKKLKRTYKVGLLTNMYPRMFNAIQASGLFPPIKWDEIIDTTVVMLKKPDLRIFELAQQRAGVPHQEIFFVDNTEKNITAAKSISWQTFLYDSSDYEKSTHELEQYLRNICNS